MCLSKGQLQGNRSSCRTWWPGRDLWPESRGVLPGCRRPAWRGWCLDIWLPAPPPASAAPTLKNKRGRNRKPGQWRVIQVQGSEELWIGFTVVIITVSRDFQMWSRLLIYDCVVTYKTNSPTVTWVFSSRVKYSTTGPETYPEPSSRTRFIPDFFMIWAFSLKDIRHTDLKRHITKTSTYNKNTSGSKLLRFHPSGCDVKN